MQIPAKPSQQEYRSGYPLTSIPPKGDLPRIEAYLASKKEGSFTPAVPRYASTVMLVRESPENAPAKFRSCAAVEDRVAPPNGIEVFMMRRQSTMDFLPDAVVFPGGRNDAADSDPALPWAGPTPEEWSRRLKKDEDTTRCLIVAAVREVFEESGVLLAGPTADTVVENIASEEWVEERKALADHKQSFAEMLIRRGLVLRSDLLCFHSNFITPAYLPKRFDTFFFSARCPKGQDPDDLSREAYIADWCEPQWALDKNDEGTIKMVPVTIYHTGMIARANSIDELMSADKVAKPFMFEPHITEDGTIYNCDLLP